MAILVVGGTGHIGSLVVEELAKRGAALGDKPSSGGTLSGVEDVTGDVLDIDFMRGLLRTVSTVFVLNPVVADELTRALPALDLVQEAAIELLQREHSADPLPGEMIEVVGAEALTGEAIAHLWGDPAMLRARSEGLKGADNGVMDRPKVRVFVQGEGKPPFVKLTQGWLRASHRGEDPALTTEMRPFLRHDRAEPIEPGRTYELRVELLPLSVLVRRGERLRLEISNWESSITEAPMTHWYGQKVGTDTYHHDAAHPSRLRLHERPRQPSTQEGDAA